MKLRYNSNFVILPWKNNQQAVNQLHKVVIKPANGAAEAAEHEGNTATSVTAGISISLMDTGSASLPITDKGSERLQATACSLTTDQPQSASLLSVS